MTRLSVLLIVCLWSALASAAPGDKIGPSIGDELAAAGVAGLPFSWNPATGQLRTDDPALTAAQRTAILAVLAAHDPTKLSAATIAEQAKAKAKQDLIAHCADVEADTLQSAKIRKLCGLLKQVLP